MLSQSWMFLVLSILLSLLFAAFLFFYFRNFILMKQKLLSTETELTKTQTKERIQTEAFLDLKSQMESAQCIDSITGLITHQLFEDRLNQVLGQSKRHDLIFAVLFLNFNEFKMIIHALGLGAREQILKESAKRMQGCIRQLDTVARLPGDDFALILPQLSKSETAAYVAQRLLDAMAEPFLVNEKEIYVASNIGIAIYPEDGEDVTFLMKNAETAAHQAAVLGHHGYQFYRHNMQLESRREFILSTNLQNPSVYKDFLIYYQPILHLEKKVIHAMRATLCWNHVDFGLLTFHEFSKLAENNGTIIAMGEWMMRHACQQFQTWKTADHDVQMLVIPIMLRQLEKPNFIYKTTQLLHEFQIEPASVMFEIEESAMTSKMGLGEKTLFMLKELGTQIVISEFGTGNMVLWRLQRFQVDSLKIAESIIKNITISKEISDIVKMIIALADTLGLYVIASGVETSKQAEVLKNMGCYLMEGDLFSKPLLPTEFTASLRKSILEKIF